MSSLFDPATIGRFSVANRLVMAPMTRNRAGADAVPTALMAEYYAQRATAGLIVTEGTQPCAGGQGYPDTPGLHTDAQVAGWRTVTDAVHAAGGRIFAQLMHTGRVGHPDINGLQPVAPSPVVATGQIFTGTGMRALPVPRQLSVDEIDATIGAFADAARRAIVAGFDGVEIHGANGYLVHQFLANNTNLRTDEYGSSPAGRIRFAVDTVAAVSAAIGPDRVGLRISPANPFNDIAETDTATLYGALLQELDRFDLAYLHLAFGSDHDPVAQAIRAGWSGTLIVNPLLGPDLPDDGGRATAERWLGAGADLISHARSFLANPDLVERLRTAAPINRPDPATFYGGGAAGYIDYPASDAVAR